MTPQTQLSAVCDSLLQTNDINETLLVKSDTDFIRLHSQYPKCATLDSECGIFKQHVII